MSHPKLGTKPGRRCSGRPHHKRRSIICLTLTTPPSLLCQEGAWRDAYDTCPRLVSIVRTDTYPPKRKTGRGLRIEGGGWQNIAAGRKSGKLSLIHISEPTRLG